MEDSKNIQLHSVGSYTGEQKAHMTSPDIVVKKNLDWVNYGVDNLYPDYLIDLADNVGLHNAIIEGVARYIYGNGIALKDPSRNVSAATKLNALFSGHGKTSIKRFIHDYKLHGRGYLLVRFSKARTPLSLDFYPAETIRVGKVNEDGVIDGFWYSADWENYRKAENIPVFVEKLTDSNAGGEKVIEVRNIRSGSFYYGRPDYTGTILSIDTAKRISRFHNNNIKNGLFPTVHFSFSNGVPSQEEQRQIERKLKQKFGEDGDGERLMTTYTNGETPVEVTTIEPAGADKMFEFLGTDLDKKIFQGHGITNGMFFGVKEASGFSNNSEELESSWELFERTVLNYYREDILEALDPMLKLMGTSSEQCVFISSKPFEEVVAVSETGEPIAPEDMLADSEVSYNGAQISSALSIIEGVSLGTVTKEQAVVFLVQMLNFDISVANALFGIGDAVQEIEKSPSELRRLQLESKRDYFTEQDEDLWLDHLEELGEVLDEDEWEMISEAPASEDETSLAKTINLFEEYANEGLKSNQDKGLFKVRYSYSPQRTSEKSRDFCKRMVSASKRGIVYRMEDLSINFSGSMSAAGENKGLSPKGENRYDIFKYKGGAFCHHFWMRKVYQRKRGADGKILPNAGLDNDKQTTVARAREAGVPIVDNTGGLVGKKPNDMPKNGRLN